MKKIFNKKKQVIFLSGMLFAVTMSHGESVTKNLGQTNNQDVLIQSNNPNIQYSGRWFDKAEMPGVKFGINANVIKLTIKNTDHLSIKLNTVTSDPKNKPYLLRYQYRLYDNSLKPSQSQFTQLAQPIDDNQNFKIVHLLSNGTTKLDNNKTYVLEFVRKGLADTSTTQVSGFYASPNYKLIQNDNSKPKVHFQIIGDSISEGFEDECPAGLSGDDCYPTQYVNEYATFGPQLVRLLAKAHPNIDFTWSDFAFSGIGASDLVHPYKDETDPGMPMMSDVYDNANYAWIRDGVTLPKYRSAVIPYHFNQDPSITNVVLIELLTNDLESTQKAQTQENKDKIIKDYISLIRKIREQYPNALIFCMDTLVTKGESRQYMFNSTDLLNKIIQKNKEINNDSNVYLLGTGPSYPNNWLKADDFPDGRYGLHPYVEGHIKLAKHLLPEVEANQKFHSIVNQDSNLNLDNQ